MSEVAIEGCIDARVWHMGWKNVHVEIQGEVVSKKHTHTRTSGVGYWG